MWHNVVAIGKVLCHRHCLSTMGPVHCACNTLHGPMVHIHRSEGNKVSLLVSPLLREFFVVHILSLSIPSLLPSPCISFPFPCSHLPFPPSLPPPSFPPPPPSSLSLSPSLTRTAMEKMQNVYKENPKLGDPNSLGQSLEQTSQKIAALTEERDKFAVYIYIIILYHIYT